MHMHRYVYIHTHVHVHVYHISAFAMQAARARARALATCHPTREQRPLDPSHTPAHPRTLSEASNRAASLAPPTPSSSTKNYVPSVSESGRIRSIIPRPWPLSLSLPLSPPPPPPPAHPTPPVLCRAPVYVCPVFRCDHNATPA